MTPISLNLSMLKRHDIPDLVCHFSKDDYAITDASFIT